MGVATTIANQIGSRALYMIGAKNLAGSGTALTFKVMRNGAKVTHVKVTLDAQDTYSVDFLKCSTRSKNPDNWVKTVADFSGIYCDNLTDLIGSTLGLATSL